MELTFLSLNNVLVLQSWFCWRTCETWQTYSDSDWEWENIRKSSRYTNTNLFNMSRRTSLTNAWKLQGHWWNQMASPDIHSGQWVCWTKFHSSLYRIRARWYTLHRSNFINILAPWSSSKVEVIRGRGYLSLTVMSLRPGSHSMARENYPSWPWRRSQRQLEMMRGKGFRQLRSPECTASLPHFLAKRVSIDNLYAESCLEGGL